MIFLNVHMWAKKICASVNMSIILPHDSIVRNLVDTKIGLARHSPKMFFQTPPLILLKKYSRKTPPPKNNHPFGGGERLEVPFPRASGEKCFLNPKGFRKFFECNPNHYAKDFVGWSKFDHGQFT